MANTLIDRPTDLNRLTELLVSSPAVAMLGARQVGKSTMASMVDAQHRFDLDNPLDRRRFETPMLTLEPLWGLIVIDEVQRAPELFSLLRHLIDTRPAQRYLLLGSASRDLIRQTSESLAGRIALFELGGLQLNDVGSAAMSHLWLRGGLPRSLLAEHDAESLRWRHDYIATFLERDIPQLGITIPARTLRRFWTMIAHYHGQILNQSELARSFGISDMTVRRYIDILQGTFMVRLLQPWHTNTAKRQVKRPKLYLRDSGLLHALMTIENESQLRSHNKLGASWEGFALETVIRSLGLRDEEAWFWATHGGAELDLFFRRGGEAWGVEFKFSDAPQMTRAMAVALEDLGLRRLFVVYPGRERYMVHEAVEVVPLADVASISW